MYNKEFCKIYNEYDWQYFALTMGASILDYFKVNNIIFHNHLDLCSGTGDLCNFFHNHNINSKGVDISSAMVDIAKNKYPHITFNCCDIKNYVDNQKYELITCTCDAINHILDINNLQKIINNITTLLQPNGYFIFDVFDPTKITFEEQFESIRENNTKVIYYLTKLPNNKMNTNIKILTNNNLIHTENIQEKLYTYEELSQILQNNGLKIIQAQNQIYKEQQRINNKIYFITKLEGERKNV